MSNDDLTPEATDREADGLIEIEQLVTTEVKLADEAAAIAERREQIKAQLLAKLEPGTHQAGPYQVIVKAGPRRLDTAAVEAAYPVVEHPELYSPRPDTTKVKHHLAPAELERYQTVGKPQVVIQ